MTSVLRSPPLSQQADDLSNPFGQMSLSRQGSTEAADPSSALFQPPLISQHPQQTSFIMASTGQPLPTSNYSTSSHAPPTQQVLPPQGYMQPPQQTQVSYCSPGQYPNSNQQYRPLSHPVAYSPQRGQQLPQPSQQPGKRNYTEAASKGRTATGEELLSLFKKRWGRGVVARMVRVLKRNL